MQYSRKPEIAELEFEITVEQQILRFDVSVHNVLMVQLSQPLEHLVHDGDYHFRLHSEGVLPADQFHIVPADSAGYAPCTRR